MRRRGIKGLACMLTIVFLFGMVGFFGGNQPQPLSVTATAAGSSELQQAQ